LVLLPAGRGGRPAPPSDARAARPYFFSESAGLAQMTSFSPKVIFGSHRKGMSLLVFLKFKNASST
jgi:hypothetical protein